MDMCIDMGVDKCTDIGMDICIDTCTDLCMYMCIDMYIDLYACICIDIRIDYLRGRAGEGRRIRLPTNDILANGANVD